MEKGTKKVTMESLAGMVQRGFQGITDEMRGQFGVVNKRLDTLEKGQEEIKLRLDNVA